MMQYADSAQVIPDVPAAYPVIEIPEFELKEVAPLFDNLPEPKLSEEYQTDGTVRPRVGGTILYRTSLPEVKEGTTLLIDEVHDWAQSICRW